MTLREYMDWKKLTPGAFGDLIGVSRQAVMRYRDGKRIPKKEIMPRIFEVTGGKVSADSFFQSTSRAA